MYSLRGVDEGADNLFVGIFAGFLVGCQNHVSRLDILNRYQASSGDNHSSRHKALGRDHGVGDGSKGGGQCGILPDLIRAVYGGVKRFLQGFAVDQLRGEGGEHGGGAVCHGANHPVLQHIAGSVHNALAAEVQRRGSACRPLAYAPGDDADHAALAILWVVPLCRGSGPPPDGGPTFPLQRLASVRHK